MNMPMRPDYCQGDRYAVRDGLVPMDLMKLTTVALKTESRSKMMNLGASSNGKASLSCWITPLRGQVERRGEVQDAPSIARSRKQRHP